MNRYRPDIHDRKSIRLKNYNYSQPGLYFITICINENELLFGKIESDEMILNEAGAIVNECWLKIPEHFQNAILHHHIIMPNHIHGIIELVSNDRMDVGAEYFPPFRHTVYGSIGSIIKGFKIGVTKWFRTNTDIYKVWQRNYYEHIIRDEQSLQRISQYIIDNPQNRKDDEFYFVR